MLPPSSSSDEGPALRERNFDARASKNTRYPQERVYGGNGDGDGRDSRGRYSDDDEETGATTAPRDAGAGDNRDDNDASPPRAPQASSLERALSHSELEELGFAAHLLLKISSSPIKRARVDLVSFKWSSVFPPGRRERASPGFVFCRFFLPSSCRRSIGCASARIVVNSVGSTIQGLARNLLSPFFY